MDSLPVSIIVPNYNGEKLLATNLTSVTEAARRYPGVVEIIVVDDASGDNSVTMIAEQFPEIRIVIHDVNKGFAEAVHSGLRSSRHPIIILLNSDVRPEPQFIAPLISWFSRPDTFAVSPLIRDQRGEPLRVSWNIGKIIRGEIRNQNWRLDQSLSLAKRGIPLRSLYASGGSVALRKEMFLQLGGFLSIYKPFYYEDRDLGTRAWQHGWQTYFEPQSMVIHDHLGTINRYFATRKIKIIQKRNRLYYLWLHLSTRKLFFSHIPWVFFRLLTRLLKMDLIYPAALFRALPGLGEIIRLRREFTCQGDIKALEKIIEGIAR